MNADDVITALRAKTEALQAQLLAKVQANLSGDVLQTQSGALKASIVADLAFDSASFTASVASEGVPYATIQEYGGRTAPHDIVPVKAKALAFAGGSGLVFARRVRHPGSLVPARAPFGTALGELRATLVSELKGSLLDALGAS